MELTFEALTRAVADGTGLTRVRTRALLLVVARVLAELPVHAPRRLCWPGLGVFYAKAQAPKAVRHPVTGTAVQLPPHVTLGFRAARRLRRREPPPERPPQEGASP